MTQLLAGVFLLLIPVIVHLLRSRPAKRHIAFSALVLLIFLNNLPVTGNIYGWWTWFGTVRGMSVSLGDVIALALILTRRPQKGALPFWGLFAFYGGAVFVSIFFSSVWMATTFAWWQYGRIVLLFAAVAGEVNREKLYSSLLFGISLGLIYQSGYVISQKLTGVVQASGTLTHQNILGLMIELSILPLIAALLGGERRKIIFLGVVAGLICIAGSGSRGTMGIAGGAILVLLLLSIIRRVTARKMMMAGLTAAVLMAAVPFAIYTLEKRFNGSDFVTEEGERDAFERAAKAMARDHPFGVGSNMYVSVSNAEGYAALAGVGWQFTSRAVPVHNAYLLARAETGLWGLIAFICLLSVPMAAGLVFAFADRRDPRGEAALGSAVALSANLIHNMFEFATHTYAIQALAVLNIAVIAALIRDRRITRRSKATSRRKAPLGTVMSGPSVAA